MIKRFLQVFFSILFLLFIFPVGYFVLDHKNDVKNIPRENIKGVVSYVINLDRSKDRLDSVLPLIKNVGYEVNKISAVDGAKIPEDDIKSLVDLDNFLILNHHYPKKGTLGCSLSHIKAWQDFLDSDKEFAIVFEDDVTFEPRILRDVAEELTLIKDKWDIVNFEPFHRGMPVSIYNFKTGNRLVYYLTEITHTGSYMINRKAASLFLEKSLPIKMAVDHYYARSWEFGLKYTGVENPRIVKQKKEVPSIINNSAELNMVSNDNINFIDKVKMLISKVQSVTIMFLYNMKNSIKELLLSLVNGN